MLLPHVSVYDTLVVALNPASVASGTRRFVLIVVHCGAYSSQSCPSIIHRTMRIGSERHLVCIEDPFELSHDLGRTIDRSSVVVGGGRVNGFRVQFGP